MTERLHVVLLAGGRGTRFWPLSRASRPKQFLRLAGSRSLLQATWDRARRLAPEDHVWVVTSKTLAGAVREQLPRLRRGRIVLEPSPRGTAAAIGLACRRIERVDADAIVAILPTDHVLRDARAFARAVAKARLAAAGGALVCLGVQPDRPETGFGYIEPAGRPARGAAARVVRFVEKPGPARARAWLRSGRHLWNAGICVASARTILDEIRLHAPRVGRAVAGAALRDVAAWERGPHISFDRAVLEKSERVAVVPLHAGWADIGSWAAAADVLPARLRGDGARIVRGSPGSAIFGGERLVALVDVPGVVVVDTADALLVVSRSSTEKLRDVVRAVGRLRPEVLR